MNDTEYTLNVRRPLVYVATNSQGDIRKVGFTKSGLRSRLQCLKSDKVNGGCGNLEFAFYYNPRFWGKDYEVTLNRKLERMFHNALWQQTSMDHPTSEVFKVTKEHILKVFDKLRDMDDNIEMVWQS